MSEEMDAAALIARIKAATPAQQARLIETMFDWCADRIEKLEAELAAARATPARPETPEGWRLVPVEPTLEMEAAGNAIDADLRSQGFNGAEVGVIFNAMLSAAPPAPGGDNEQG